MWFLKEITKPNLTTIDVFVFLFAWGATNNLIKTVAIGFVWFVIEALIRNDIRNKEIKLRLKQKVELIRQEEQGLK